MSVKGSRSDAENDQQDRMLFQELDETMYWFELLVEYDLIHVNLLTDLQKEADELMAIMVTGVKTIKSHGKK